MSRLQFLSVLSAIALLFQGCTRAVVPELVSVSLQGNPQVAIRQDSSGKYEILPSTAIVEVRFPAFSQLNVLADGSVLQQASDPATQTALQTQGLGFYNVVNSTVDSTTGLVDFQIFVAPPVLKLNGPEVDIQIEDQSTDNTNVGADLVSPPIKIALVRSAPPPSDTLQSGAYAATGCGFLGYAGPSTPGFVNSAQDAAAYYAAIDLTGSKTTLAAWKTVNGFSPTDNSLDDATAIYFNANDLAFGRSMHMKAQNGNIAYYVSNYRSVDDARLNTNLIATVAMDYSPVPGVSSGNPFTKFYVYDNRGILVPSADLDGCGQKFVPGVCQVCHNAQSTFFSAPGGAGQQTPDLNARFLLFDLNNFEYSSTPGFHLSDQQAMFQKLNLGVMNTNLSPAEQELIQGWYQCSGTSISTCATSTQDSNYIPLGWNVSPTASSNYLNGVKSNCRTCHVSSAPPLDFDSAGGFQVFASQVIARVCQSSPANPATIPMPQARVTWNRFWLGLGSSGPFEVLSAAVTSPGHVVLSNGGTSLTVNGANCPNY